MYDDLTYQTSAELCERMAAECDTAILAFSTGKDSIAAWLQMRRYFKRVIPYYCYLVPGLEFVEESPAKETPQISADIIYQVGLPLLCKGDRGEPVRALQMLLIGRDYSCGGYGVDGDFGPATEQSVKNYQTENGLLVDGEVGGETWAALLGVR